MVLWGADGVIELTGGPQKRLTLYRNGRSEAEQIEPDAPDPGGYLRSFVRDVRGDLDGDMLTTTDVLRATRISLLAQDAADGGKTNVACV